MCGINGFTWKDENLIQKMNKKIKHRGPDDDGFFVDNNISLGHNRLSIIDLSDKGHQPMHYKNLTIVYNGEVYNFKEIKNEWNRLINLGTYGICTDFPNDLQKFVSVES